MKESGIVPSLIKDGLPIVHEAVGGGIAVDLRGHCLDDEPDVDWEGFEGAFGKLDRQRRARGRAWMPQL